MKSPNQLTENNVVEAVCRHLDRQGYRIHQRLQTNQKGEDIIALREGVTLSIEAKGSTSASPGSRRFGAEFDSAAIRVNVAEAVYKSIQILSRGYGDSSLRAGVAFPENAVYRREIATVAPVLKALGVRVFWVRSADDVLEEGQDVV